VLGFEDGGAPGSCDFVADLAVLWIHGNFEGNAAAADR